MKIVLQRVTNAKVTIDEQIIGSINKGLLISLVVSLFTLCADCSHGNRPRFTGAGTGGGAR